MLKSGGGLEEWAGRSGRRRVAGLSRECLRFAFYGRVSTDDWQDPASSLIRQREQAGALVRGHGIIIEYDCVRGAVAGLRRRAAADRREAPCSASWCGLSWDGPWGRSSPPTWAMSGPSDAAARAGTPATGTSPRPCRPGSGRCRCRSRDRAGTFEPVMVPKRAGRVAGGLDDMVTLGCLKHGMEIVLLQQLNTAAAEHVRVHIERMRS